MAIALLTFQLYSDSGLTTYANTAPTITANSDLSDGYHDFVYYFGSTDTTQQLQAVSSPGTDNIVLTPTYILPAWIASTAYALGYSIIPSTANGYRYVCTTAGTTDASAPTWGTILNGTTTSGTAVFTLVSTTSPVTEIKLATSSGGLATATGGAALVVGTTLLGGVANAFAIHMRVTNTITTVSSSVSTPEIGVNINAIQQTSV